MFLKNSKIWRFLLTVDDIMQNNQKEKQYGAL